MDNDIITIFPGNVIVDVIGTPLAPTMRPTPLLPGLSFSTVGRGTMAIPAGTRMPQTRGSLRVSFTHLTPPPGFVYLIVRVGAATAGGGMVVLCFDDSSISVLHSPDGIGLEWAVATAGAVPDDLAVTVTASWDAENPIDGIYHAKAQLEGYPLEMQVVFGGATPYVPLVMDSLTIAEADVGATITFPGTVGRVQFGNRVL